MLILLFCFITYQISNNQNKKNYFNEILINGKLNVVLNPNYYDYFLYNTEIQGYNYELLQEFANYLKLELVILTEENYQKNISSLINHDIDIFIHYNSKPESNFLTKSTLANKENYALISYDSILQIDDNILLKKNKSKLFNNYFNNKSNKIISLSEINLANNLKKYYQNFTIDSSLNFSITSCWIVDSKSEILLDSINSWYKNYQQTKQYKNKNDYLTQYFQKINLRNNYFSQFGKNISQFDEIIKKHCQNWDWRFISALIYEESRFNPNAKNKTSGAFGLMQLLPYNYDLYAFDTSLNVASQIKAGIGLLNTINQQLKTEIPDSLSRIKLSLAAYNIGLSHIEDAIRLSEKFSTTDTYSWNTLSYFLENLSNPDYYNDSVVLRGKCNAVVGVVFANRIYNRYLNYKNLIE